MRKSRETASAFLFFIGTLSIEQQTGHSGQHNHQDRMNLEFPSQTEGNRKNQVTFVINKILLIHEQQGGSSDQAHCRRTQAQES